MARSEQKISAQIQQCEECRTPVLVVNGHLAPAEGHQVVVAVVDGRTILTVHSLDCPDRLPEEMLTRSSTAGELYGGRDE